MQSSNCPCKENCATGCPCPYYECPEFTTKPTTTIHPENDLYRILVLPEGEPFVTDNYGNEFEIDWITDGDVYSTGLCAINFNNEMLIFG